MLVCIEQKGTPIPFVLSTEEIETMAAQTINLTQDTILTTQDPRTEIKEILAEEGRPVFYSSTECQGWKEHHIWLTIPGRTGGWIKYTASKRTYNYPLYNVSDAKPEEDSEVLVDGKHIGQFRRVATVNDKRLYEVWVPSLLLCLYCESLQLIQSPKKMSGKELRKAARRKARSGR